MDYRRYFWGYLQSQSPPSEEAQPTLRPWTGFEPVRLETPRIPKHAWFHFTTATKKMQVHQLSNPSRNHQSMQRALN
ncbi:hypothetical protein E2C01_002340 [Portunus trituberculatus]|uniref:Uncharacterized protein n=1 Tax=Portunus trituberculatus TaxID=210409 RepID=A0A5B7CJ49_PORTR|nr:hypothetical protein [Portunus trituberculatus]